MKVDGGCGGVGWVCWTAGVMRSSVLDGARPRLRPFSIVERLEHDLVNPEGPGLLERFLFLRFEGFFPPVGSESRRLETPTLLSKLNWPIIEDIDGASFSPPPLEARRFLDFSATRLANRSEFCRTVGMEVSRDRGRKGAEKMEEREGTDRSVQLRQRQVDQISALLLV